MHFLLPYHTNISGAVLHAKENDLHIFLCLSKLQYDSPILVIRDGNHGLKLILLSDMQEVGNRDWPC